MQFSFKIEDLFPNCQELKNSDLYKKLILLMICYRCFIFLS